MQSNRRLGSSVGVVVGSTLAFGLASACAGEDTADVSSAFTDVTDDATNTPVEMSPVATPGEPAAPISPEPVVPDPAATPEPAPVEPVDPMVPTEPAPTSMVPVEEPGEMEEPVEPEPPIEEPEPEPEPLPEFSFFMTSLEGMRRLSGSDDGFGGDLRYGEATGLDGADKICAELAEHSMPGAAAKEWRAFLSVAEGPDGEPVHAIDRVGEGPWYDRLGRTVALTTDDLLQVRPANADPAIANDLPNEYGVPNQTPDPAEGPVDNHHVLTGTDENGQLYEGGTCGDWMSASADSGQPRTGFSWPRGNGGRAGSNRGQHWMTSHDEAGCTPGIQLEQIGGAPAGATSVGAGGGYGAIYCFALTP